jgi:hypothetical protein
MPGPASASGFLQFIWILADVRCRTSDVRRTTSYNTDVAHDVVRQARTTSYPYDVVRGALMTSYIDVVRQARTTSQHTMS